MAIITKGTVVKGTAATFTLNKTDLAANSLVSGDAYYSVQSNWANVTLEYKSSVGSQPKYVVFDATLSTPTASFFASATARDIFQIKRVTITDKDGGKFPVPRANLTTADFDIDFTVVVSALFSNTLKSASLAVSNGGLTLTGVSAPYAEWGYLDTYTNPSSGNKVYFEMTQNVLTGGTDNYLGVTFVNANPAVFSEPSDFPFGDNAILSYHGNTSVIETVAGTSGGLFNYATGWVQGDVVMIAIDYTANKIYFGKNGTWGNAGNPTAGTNGNMLSAQSGFSRAYIGVTLGGNSQVTKASSPLYTPSGFTAI